MGHDLAAALLDGDRRALARAITLVESTRTDHRATARSLLDEILPSTGHGIRVGVSGAPGSGKSTLIESLGLQAITDGMRCAVLAIDPSSSVSGGSILGDKTRMSDLGRHPHAYIRPSPSAGTLGGVARRTREALLLCEAAGFDLVIVETVGVGQSEVAVSDLVDLFLLIVAPGGGDELQGIKRGIMELADVVAVNKADGDLVDAANRAASDLRKALHLLRPKRAGSTVRVVTCSAVEGTGVGELWASVRSIHHELGDAELARLRRRQDVSWMWREVTETLVESLRADEHVRALVAGLEAAVADQAISPASAAERLLEAYLGRAL